MNLWLGGVLILFILSYVNCGSLPVSSSLNEPQNDSDGTQSDTNEDIVPKSDEIERKVSYDGVQVWHIKTDDSVKQETVNHLKAKFDLSTMNLRDDSIDVLVKPESISAVKSILKESNVDFDVVIDNLQTAIDQENPKEDDDELENRNGHRMTWTSYHGVADIHGYLEYLAKTYPSICSAHDIGYSHQRRPIKMLKISNGNPGNKAIWIDGGVHAREWISPATVTYIINELINNYDESPLIRNTNWYIVPSVNPDGYEHSRTYDRLWRKNRAGGTGFGRCVGVDLNRNFGHEWGGQGASHQMCTDTYAGPFKFSEPETRAVRNFIEPRAREINAYLSFHSYGQYILCPWGYRKAIPPDNDDLIRVGTLAANKILNISKKTYRVGNSALTLYPASGGSDDWAKSLHIKYAFTMELGDTGRYGFILPAQEIKTNAMDGYEMVKVLLNEIHKK